MLTENEMLTWTEMVLACFGAVLGAWLGGERLVSELWEDCGLC